MYKENQSLDVINVKLQGLSKLKVLEENSTDTTDERIRALVELMKQTENYEEQKKGKNHFIITMISILILGID